MQATFLQTRPEFWLLVKLYLQLMLRGIFGSPSNAGSLAEHDPRQRTAQDALLTAQLDLNTSQDRNGNDNHFWPEHWSSGKNWEVDCSLKEDRYRIVIVLKR